MVQRESRHGGRSCMEEMSALFEREEDLPPIHLSGDPCALGYDHRRGVLYAAEGKSGTILALDGWQRKRVAAIESGGGIGLPRVGGLALGADGTIYATRPQPGTLFAVGEHTELLDALAPRWQRGGIVYAEASHALFVSQYLAAGGEGIVSRFDLDRRELVGIACGFDKPVGLALLGQTLIVADAALGAVYRVDLVDGHAVRCAPIAEGLDRPVAVCGAGNHGVLVASYRDAHGLGSVRQVRLDGRIDTVLEGAWEPSAIVATDDHIYLAIARERTVLVKARNLAP